MDQRHHWRQEMPGDTAYRISRLDVEREPLVSDAPTYADSFEIRLARPDGHSAEEWTRTALEESPATLRTLIRLVHERVARFQLAPNSDPDRILGWRVAHAEPDVLMLEAAGPMLRAAIVARRRSPTTATLTTFLFFQQAAARPIWWAIGPIHRRAVPHLLNRAATKFTRAEHAEPVGTVRRDHA
jgi:hypothetical protein